MTPYGHESEFKKLVGLESPRLLPGDLPEQGSVEAWIEALLGVGTDRGSFL